MEPGESVTVTVGEVLAGLQSVYPGVHDAAVDERGAIRPHVNVFVGDENVRFLDGLATPVPPDAEVWILPAVSGGQTERSSHSPARRSSRVADVRRPLAGSPLPDTCHPHVCPGGSSSRQSQSGLPA